MWAPSPGISVKRVLTKFKCYNVTNICHFLPVVLCFQSHWTRMTRTSELKNDGDTLHVSSSSSSSSFFSSSSSPSFFCSSPSSSFFWPQLLIVRSYLQASSVFPLPPIRPTPLNMFYTTQTPISFLQENSQIL